jgi:hypothetical protein
MADDAEETGRKKTEHDQSEEVKTKDPSSKGNEDTASLMRQLLSALEKREKPGEHSKGEEIPILLYLARSASSTPAGVKTMRRPNHEGNNRRVGTDMAWHGTGWHGMARTNHQSKGGGP